MVSDFLGTEKHEKSPRFLEFGPQNLDFSKQCEQFGLFRAGPKKSETSFVNHVNAVSQKWSQVTLARRVRSWNPLEGRCKATWEREFKLPWREAGPPNHLDAKVDSDQ